MADDAPALDAPADASPDPTPQAVLQDLAHQLRAAPITDTQTSREVHLSEADVQAMAACLEQVAQSLGPSVGNQGPAASHDDDLERTEFPGESDAL
jgi:hypothetical protein